MNGTAASRDNPATLVAIGLLAYASADIVHHAVGHGGMCLAQGGHIVSLSSIYLACTVRGAAVDLSGPFANLILGLVALVAAHRTSNAARLFFGLAAGFNLMWFSLQLVFSAATRTDDFAWAMDVHGVGRTGQWLMIAVGALGYFAAARATAAVISPLAAPRARLTRIVWTAWLTAGLLACITGLLGAHPVPDILHHAAPQSFGLAIGLLFVPALAALRATAPAAPIGLSVGWIAAAVAMAGLSIAFLGPGFAV